jgi:hypothetical protein
VLNVGLGELILLTLICGGPVIGLGIAGFFIYRAKSRRSQGPQK